MTFLVPHTPPNKTKNAAKSERMTPHVPLLLGGGAAGVLVEADCPPNPPEGVG